MYRAEWEAGPYRHIASSKAAVFVGSGLKPDVNYYYRVAAAVADRLEGRPKSGVLAAAVNYTSPAPEERKPEVFFWPVWRKETHGAYSSGRARTASLRVHLRTHLVHGGSSLAGMALPRALRYLDPRPRGGLTALACASPPLRC
jgi:hypothetical protein